MEPNEAQQLTERLSQELTSRRPTVDERLAYFKGDLGRLRYATDEFARYFGDRFRGFADNWCRPVIEAPAERMTLVGVRLGEERRADAQLARVWDSTDCDRGFAEAVAVMMSAGWAYALVHPGDSPRVTWESPSQAIVDRDPVTGDIRAGLVSWIDDKHDYATLYTSDEVWKWQRSRTPDAWDKKLPSPGGGWEPREVAGETWPIVNPLGEVPMIELRNQTLLDDVPISDISGVMSMQDAINLVWAYLLNALDYASLPTRLVGGADAPRVPILDKDGQETGMTRPLDLDTLVKDRVLWVPGQGVTFDEWSAANLDAFSKVIEHAVEHIAAQTRTPPHYLVARMVNTAAESLTIAEAGLVSKTRERITFVKAPLRRLFRLIALALGEREKADQAQWATLLWSNIQYRSEAQLADALLKKRQIGYPLQWIAEQDGLDPAEVDRLMEMVEQEQADPLGDRLMREVADAAAGRGGTPVPPDAAA